MDCLNHFYATDNLIPSNPSELDIFMVGFILVGIERVDEWELKSLSKS